MQTKSSKVSIKLSLRDKNEHGLYTVAIRYYEPGIEKYIPTAYRTTKSEWKASRGESYHNVQLVKDQLAKEITLALESCGEELTYDRFKSSLKGERLSSTMSLITLIEKHLLDHPSYKHGTVELYEYTKTTLLGIEQSGHSIDISSFETENDVRNLELAINKHSSINKTTLSMHMQNIKAAATTGKKIGWIKTVAFHDYKKPSRKVGMTPNSLEDFNAIKNYDCGKSNSMKFGRDLWCFMVFCGGMEARNIAHIKWTDVYDGYFHFKRIKTEDSNEESNVVYISLENEFIRYIFNQYGVQANKPDGFVFDVLTRKVTAQAKEDAIKSFYERISKNVKKVGERLNVRPLPNCKRSRPTFANLSQYFDLDIHETSKMMAHSSLKTTQVYFNNMPTPQRIGISAKFNQMLAATNAAPMMINNDTVLSGEADIFLFRKDDAGKIICDPNDFKIQNWRIDQVLVSDYFELPSARPPLLDGFMNLRERILSQTTITEHDEKQLEIYENEFGVFPTGESIEQIKAMLLFKSVAQKIKSQDDKDKETN